MDNLPGLVALFFAAMLGGGLNAVAGGGSLISFPSLVAFGIPALNANATNTAALWPGSIGGVFGFREELRHERGLLAVLIVPSLIGGLLGALILVNTSKELFDRIVPFLVLFATLIFAFQDRIKHFGGGQPQPSDGAEQITLVSGVGGVLFQILIATYGGYFGAGMSIIMMASMGLMGLRNIHRINGLKTALAISINGIALFFFALARIVRWDLAVIMGVGSIMGGYAAARISKRVEPRYLRAFVVLVGIVVTLWLFAKQYL